MYQDYTHTKFGYWIISAHETAITQIAFSTDKPSQNKPNFLTKRAIDQLRAYFNREITTFNLPLNTSSYSQFYQDVWSMVAHIPYGKVCSYSEIAIRLNNPKAVRAIGMANGKNPFPIVIPCHRVIGKDHSLTGYVYGIELKKALLVHEGYMTATPTLF